MNGLWVLAQVIPEHIRILKVSLRVPLLGMDEMREFCRVPDEEDRRVVEHPVPVALFSTKFESKATRIAGGVRRAGLSSDGGESSCQTNFLAHRGEQLVGCDIRAAMRYFEVTVSPCSIGVYLDNNQPYR